MTLVLQTVLCQGGDCMSGEQKFYFERGKCDPSYGGGVGGGRNWGALLGLGNADCTG